MDDGPITAPTMTTGVTAPAPPPVPTSPAASSQSQLPTPPPAPGPQAPPQQPQQSPQQIQLARHALIGKAVQTLMGNSTEYHVDPQSGQTVAVKTPQSPGQWGRSMVLGAMLGLASGGEAQGGSAGGFLGGVGAGGKAVNDYGQQQDALKRQQAQQQFKNQLEAQDEKRKQSAEGREAEGFKTEQQHRQAMIAAENAQTLRTQQLMKGESFTLFQEQANAGKVMTQVYRDAGMTPLATEKTPDDLQKILASNPQAATWDWEQTGVKVVMTKEGKPDYVPTFEAFDPNRSVKLTPGFIGQLKKAKIDDAFPGTTDQLKPGQELTPTQFAALKGQYQTAYNQDFERQKNGLTLEEARLRVKETQAQIGKLDAEAKKQAKSDKSAAILSDGLSEWNDKFGEMVKANPNASHLDAFKTLSPKSQFAISTSLVKEATELDKGIKDALGQVPPDQASAQKLMDQRDSIRQLQQSAIGAQGATNLPKPPSQGAQLTPEIAQQYKDAAGGDVDKARQMAAAAGWGGITTPAPAEKPTERSKIASKAWNYLKSKDEQLRKGAQDLEDRILAPVDRNIPDVPANK